VAVWPLPELGVIVARTPAVLVRENDAAGEAPATEAVTEYVPAIVFAVAVTLAVPEESVMAVSELNVAEAPVVGAAKVTVAPATGLLEASSTMTWSAWLKAVLTVAL
jgi:hypothetical protein